MHSKLNSFIIFIPLFFSLPLRLSLCLWAIPIWQKLQLTAPTPDLADNTTTETDDSHELQGQQGFTAAAR